MSFILQWVDVLWLVVAFFFIHKEQRLLSFAFFVTCMMMMRLQVELMTSIGYENGLIGFAPDLSVFSRGIMVYGFFYTGFILMAHYSKGGRNIIFLGASLAVFFLALFVSTIVMVL